MRLSGTGHPRASSALPGIAAGMPGAHEQTPPGIQASISAKLPWARRVVRHVYRNWGFRESGCHNVPHLLAFLVWTIGVRLGLMRKKVLVLNCDTPLDGFYCQFTALLGLLEHYERWNKVIAGVKVDFEDRGLYYDPAHGENSWEHHFHPVDTGRGSKAVEAKIDLAQRDQFRFRGVSMPRRNAFDLIGRHVRVKPHIQDKVEAFVRSSFEGFHVVGVHYRGTDKKTEAPLVPYAACFATVTAALRAAGSDGYRLFVASDEQTFVDFMQSAFPGKVLTWETVRSLDGTPTHHLMENNFKKGEDALIDCLLLSRCSQLVRTSSNLSLCSTYFNPDIPVIELNEDY